MGREDLDTIGTCRASGIVRGTTTSGAPLDRIYFCDAGCRPNPGTQLPIAWSGSQFLRTFARKGTNHLAVYSALELIFRNALAANHRNIAICLTSPMVFEQLRSGGHCEERTLKRLLNRALLHANMVGSVHLALVEAPFHLGAGSFETKQDLRDHAATLFGYAQRSR